MYVKETSYLRGEMLPILTTSAVVLLCCELGCADHVRVWEGDRAVLPCETNKTDTDIHWCKETKGGCRNMALKTKLGRKVLEPPWTYSTVYLLENGSLDILFASFTRDNGSYQCRGDTTSAVDLVVLQLMKSVSLECPATTGNSSVTCTCQVNRGNPAPKISWYLAKDLKAIRTGTFYMGDPHVYRDKYKVKVTKEMNDQTLKCQATIRERSLSDKVTLRVKYKPSIEVWTDPPNYSTDENILLICSADGNPKPDVIWMSERSFNSDEGNMTSGAGVTSDASVLIPHGVNGTEKQGDEYVTTVVYQINQLTEQHSGIYTCSAMNEEGNDTKSISLQLGTNGARIHHLHEALYRYVLPVAGIAVGVLTIGVVAVLCRHLANNRRLHTGPFEETLHDTTTTVRWTRSVRGVELTRLEIGEDDAQYETIDENPPQPPSPCH